MILFHVLIGIYHLSVNNNALWIYVVGFGVCFVLFCLVWCFFFVANVVETLSCKLWTWPTEHLNSSFIFWSNLPNWCLKFWKKSLLAVVLLLWIYFLWSLIWHLNLWYLYILSSVWSMSDITSSVKNTIRVFNDEKYCIVLHLCLII